MAKQLSIGNIVVSDKGSKHQHDYCYSNLKAPASINPRTRYSFSVRDQENPTKNRINKKEIAQLISWKQKAAAEHKQVQDSCLMRTKNQAGSLGSGPADVFLESYAFFKEPVRFDFGNDYGGDQLFLHLRREVMYRNVNVGLSCPDFFSIDDGVDSLATETDMMSSFLKENLF